MGLVYSRSDSGLVVAEHGADEAAVALALKDHDPDLRLVAQGSDLYGTRIYKVFLYRGSDRPAEFVCGWWDELGNPYPLSARLVEKVKQLDRNMRGHQTYVDPDQANATLKAQLQADAAQQEQDLADDYKNREGRVYAFPRSPALAAARRRGRRKGVAYD